MAMVHCEGADSDEPEQLLRKHLLHACHLSLHVQGLSTGYSKDVHGNVRFNCIYRVPISFRYGMLTLNVRPLASDSIQLDVYQCRIPFPSSSCSLQWNGETQEEEEEEAVKERLLGLPRLQ